MFVQLANNFTFISVQKLTNHNKSQIVMRLQCDSEQRPEARDRRRCAPSPVWSGAQSFQLDVHSKSSDTN